MKKNLFITACLSIFALTSCGGGRPNSPTTPLSGEQSNEFKGEAHNYVAMNVAVEATGEKRTSLFLPGVTAPTRSSLDTQWLGLADVSESRRSRIKAIVEKAMKEERCKRTMPTEFVKPKSGAKSSELWGLTTQKVTATINGDNCPLTVSAELSIDVDTGDRELNGDCDYKIAIHDKELQELIGADRMELTCDAEIKIAAPVTVPGSAGFIRMNGKIHSLAKGELSFHMGVEGNWIYKEENEKTLSSGAGEFRFLMGMPGYEAEVKATFSKVEGNTKEEYFLNSQAITEKEAGSYFKLP